MLGQYTRKAHDKDVNSIEVSPNDKITATASQDRTIKVTGIAMIRERRSRC